MQEEKAPLAWKQTPLFISASLAPFSSEIHSSLLAHHVSKLLSQTAARMVGASSLIRDQLRPAFVQTVGPIQAALLAAQSSGGAAIRSDVQSDVYALDVVVEEKGLEALLSLMRRRFPSNGTLQELTADYLLSKPSNEPHCRYIRCQGPTTEDQNKTEVAEGPFCWVREPSTSKCLVVSRIGLAWFHTSASDTETGILGAARFQAQSRMVKSLEDIGLLEVPAHPEPQAVTDQQFGDAFERMQRNQQGMRGLLDRLKAQQAERHNQKRESLKKADRSLQLMRDTLGEMTAKHKQLKLGLSTHSSNEG